jgi:parvulin-like peptidyl-prolyl isomerase
MARWQRERRQQTIIVTIFSAILFFTLGLVAWAASSKYYTDNLKPALMFDGRAMSLREYRRELNYQYVRFYVDYGVPAGYENDPQVLSQKSQYEGVALNALVEEAILDSAARADGITYDKAAIEAKYNDDFSQYKPRHILITPKGDDTVLADQVALAKARAVADQLKQDPYDQTLWNQLAASTSDDTSNAASGGDLGWVSKGQFVKEFEDAAKSMPLGQVSDPIKSQFGYHVLQVLETRGPQQNEFVQRALTYGVSIDDIKLRARYELLREEYTKRAQARSQSPTEQAHVAWIQVTTPYPTAGGNFQTYADQLKKVADIQAEFDKGTDFAAIAKQFSEDSATKDTGGDLGWYAHGMLTQIDLENEIFALNVGERTHQHSDQSNTVWYKVLEKDPARAIEDAQKTKIKDNAYTYWLQQEKIAHGVQKLVPGHELDG